MEAGRRLYRYAPAYLYLALPPRKLNFQKCSLFSVVVPRSQELILYILYSAFCRGSVKDVLRKKSSVENMSKYPHSR